MLFVSLLAVCSVFFATNETWSNHSKAASPLTPRSPLFLKLEAPDPYQVPIVHKSLFKAIVQENVEPLITDKAIFGKYNYVTTLYVSSLQYFPVSVALRESYVKNCELVMVTLDSNFIAIALQKKMFYFLYKT